MKEISRNQQPAEHGQHLTHMILIYELVKQLLNMNKSTIGVSGLDYDCIGSDLDMIPE